ncbi:KipI family sensor histidine kinase inhibitor [Pseudomonas sp. TE3786]
MKVRVEVVAIDCLMLRLFDAIDQAHMPWLLAAAQRLRAVFADALIDLVPSYTTLMLQYDLQRIGSAQARELIAEALQDLQPVEEGAGRLQEIPVWYHPQVGPELALLARRSGLSVSQVIELHSRHEYSVFALGFAPGFAYMGLVVPELAAPRLATPRKRVTQGSVALAERQTATYPQTSPGGWNVLGRTPTALFNRELDGYSLLQPGDRVRFVAIEHAEFIRLGGDDSPLEALP